MGEPQPVGTGSGGQEGVTCPGALGFGPMWCHGAPHGLVTGCSHSPGGGGPRVGGGLRTDGTFKRTYSELYALCSYSILIPRPEIDAIETLISQFWKPRLRELKQLGITWLITSNVWIQTQALPIPEAQHYFFQRAWPVRPMLSCLWPLHRLGPRSGVPDSSFLGPRKRHSSLGLPTWLQCCWEMSVHFHLASSCPPGGICVYD